MVFLEHDDLQKVGSGRRSLNGSVCTLGGIGEPWKNPLSVFCFPFGELFLSILCSPYNVELLKVMEKPVMNSIN